MPEDTITIQIDGDEAIVIGKAILTYLQENASVEETAILQRFIKKVSPLISQKAQESRNQRDQLN